jgi:hypothetical protein
MSEDILITYRMKSGNYQSHDSEVIENTPRVLEELLKEFVATYGDGEFELAYQLEDGPFIVLLEKTSN